MTTKKNGIDAGLFASEQLKNVFGDVNERAKAAAERSAKIVEELADLTRGNVEAMVASSKVAAKGFETLGQDAAEYSRKSFEDASGAIKGFAEAKSPTELLRLQGEFAKTYFETMMAESARMGETFVKLAGEALQPVQTQMAANVEKAKSIVK